MGFISKNNKIKLSAFLTQKGREYMINGSLEDFQVKYYSMSDPDVNYLVESNLSSGFIPDLSGCENGGVKSVAGGIEQYYTLKGGASIGPLGTNLQIGGEVLSAGFSTNKMILPAPIKGAITSSLPIVFSKVSEFAQARVYVLPASKGTTKSIVPFVSLSNGGIVKNNQPVIITVHQPMVDEPFEIKLMLVPFKSSINIVEGLGELTITGGTKA